jgi:pyruvate dehydrogenase E1 component
MYLYGTRGPEGAATSVRLLGSGAILREVIAAAGLLADDWDIKSEIWSVTSFSELARDARECERSSLFASGGETESHLQRCLPGATPVIAATDYVRAYAQLIASYLPAPFTALGTDGFGRSDTRAALRRFFEIDRYHVAIAALRAISPELHARGLERYGVQVEPEAPWER